jgi:hypothetical protein
MKLTDTTKVPEAVWAVSEPMKLAKTAAWKNISFGNFEIEKRNICGTGQQSVKSSWREEANKNKRAFNNERAPIMRLSNIRIWA